MAKSFTVTFNILGNLDKSLLAALQGATDKIKDLSKLQRAINSKALQSAKKLQNAQNALKQVEDFKALQKAIQNANKERAQELLTASRAQSARTAETQKLQQMQAAYKNLQKVQRQLLSDRDSQKLGIAQTKRDLDAAKIVAKNAKNAGDLVGFKNASAQVQALTNSLKLQRDAAKATAAEMKNINSAIKQGRQELSNQKNIVGNADKELIQSSKRAADLQLQLHNQQQQLSQLRLKIPTGNISAAESALRSQIQATTDALNREIAAIERRNQLLNNFNQSQQNLSNAYGNFQNAIQTAQTIMNPFAEAADNAMTFEKSMSRLKSLTQIRNLREGDFKTVNAEMASMEETIRNLGATTEFTMNEVAGAANKYAMSGWTPEQINSILKPTTDMASIAQMSMERVGDILSDDMTAFGIKAGASYNLAGGKVVDGARYFNDAIAYATTQSNMDLSTFHESWKYNAPTAHAMNLSLGEAVAQNMMLANAGIKGSMSGTSLRQFWTRLSAPPKAAAKSLEEMGYAANDAAQQVAETNAAMAEAGVSMESDLFSKIGSLRKFYREGIEAGRDMTGWLKGLSGQTALSGVQALFDGDVFDNAIRAKNEIDSGAIEGWAAETAAVMRDNTITEVEYLKSALDALQNSFGNALLPAIRQAAAAVTPLISSFAQWAQKNPAIIQGVAALATAVSVATVAVAGFALAMAAVRFTKDGFLTAGLLFGDLAAKITAARTALAGLNIGAWWAGVNASFMAMLSAPFTALATKITAITTALRGLTLANIGAGISSGISAAGAAFASLGSSIMIAARAAFAFAFSPVGAAIVAIALAANYAYQNWDKLSLVFSDLATTLSGIVMPALDSAKSALSNLFGDIDFGGVSEVIGNLTNMIGGGLVGAIIGMGGIFASVIAGIVTGLAGLVKTIAELGTGLSETWDKLTAGDLSGAFDSLGSTATQAADNFKNAWLDSFGAVADGIKGTNAAINTLVHPEIRFAHENLSANISGAGMGAIQAQIADIDSGKTQAALDSVGDAAQNAATNLESINNATENISQIGDSIQIAADSAQSSSDNFLTSGQNAMTAGDSMLQAGNSALNAIPGLDGLSGAAGEVASALRAKAGEISAIVINVPKVNYVPMNIGIPGGTQHLASGGIFNKGTFLTTFAESSPEAAIPIDNSARSLSLWERTGQLLGVNPSQSFYSDSSPISINISVNVNGNADKNIVRAGIEESLPRVKSFAEELAAYNHERARRSFR